MADARVPDPADQGSTGPPRIGARAAAGGALVAASMLGALTIGGAEAASTDAFVVAAGEIAPGSTLTPTDLAVVPMDLPPASAGGAFRSIDDLVGGRTLGPIGAGELVQAASLAPPEATDRALRPQLSVVVPAGRALDGTLRPGEQVDLAATYGTGIGGVTQVIGTAATVIAARVDESALVGSPPVTLTLALADPASIPAVVHAAHGDALTLVRPTPGRADPTSTYRPRVG